MSVLVNSCCVGAQQRANQRNKSEFTQQNNPQIALRVTNN
jgi:hypothetical protein